MPSFRCHLAQEESQEQTIQAVAHHLQTWVLQLPMIVKHSRQGLPLQPGHNPPDDGGDGDDSGGDSDQDGDETPVTDLDLQEKRPRKPPGDPDSSGDDRGRGRRGRYQAPITINRWGKPLPRLDLPARLHLQKASKIKQIWELWSVNVALAVSTWSDIAVTYWHQVYTQSEDSYQQWKESTSPSDM